MYIKSLVNCQFYLINYKGSLGPIIQFNPRIFFSLYTWRLVKCFVHSCIQNIMCIWGHYEVTIFFLIKVAKTPPVGGVLVTLLLKDRALYLQTCTHARTHAGNIQTYWHPKQFFRGIVINQCLSSLARQDFSYRQCLASARVSSHVTPMSSLNKRSPVPVHARLSVAPTAAVSTVDVSRLAPSFPTVTTWRWPNVAARRRVPVRAAWSVCSSRQVCPVASACPSGEGIRRNSINRLINLIKSPGVYLSI